MKIKYLALSWSTSVARDTYAYNICTLNDSGTKYRCKGGGYDMKGTVFADWLEDKYQPRLLKLSRRAHCVYEGKTVKTRDGHYAQTRWIGTPGKPTVSAGLFYGMTHGKKPKVIRLDGGCGLESMLTIARAIGLTVETTCDARGRITGFIVADPQEH